MKVLGRRNLVCAIAATCALLAQIVTDAWAQSSPVATPPTEVVTWTVVIPEGFPGDVFTWRIAPDGTYAEDGRNAATGAPIQQTLSGRWSAEGARMILRQTGLPYVFDGLVRGDRYAGVLMWGRERVSRFCAARGTKPPPCPRSEVGV